MDKLNIKMVKKFGRWSMDLLHSSMTHNSEQAFPPSSSFPVVWGKDGVNADVCRKGNSKFKTQPAPRSLFKDIGSSQDAQRHKSASQTRSVGSSIRLWILVDL